MGRITIFVADGCSQSRRAEASLTLHKLPYEVINITKYPSKRTELAALCMRMHTPQVFFNTRHVGDADDTVALLDKWHRQCLGDDDETSPESSDFSMNSDRSNKSKRSQGKLSLGRLSPSKRSISSHKRAAFSSVYARYVDEVGQHHDPVDKRLALPTTPPPRYTTRLLRSKVEEYCIQIPGEDTTTVVEMTEMLKDLIPQDKEREVDGIIYRRSFLGFQVTKTLQSVFGTSRNETELLAQQLVVHGVLYSIDGDPSTTLFDEKHVYRLHCHNTPDILNSYREWTETAYTESARLLDGLWDMLQTVETSVMDVEGLIDLKKVAKHHQFPLFEEAVCELQRVNLGELDDKSMLVCLCLCITLLSFNDLSPSRAPRCSAGLWDQCLQSHDEVRIDQSGDPFICQLRNSKRFLLFHLF
jgi:glutaredoxin